MRQMLGIVVILLAALLTASGCVATRNWVDETVGKRATEIDQRVTTVDGERRQDSARLDGQVQQQVQRLDGVEAHVKDGAQRIEGMGGRIQGLETSVNEATETAKAAKTRAEDVDSRLTRLWDKRNARLPVESLHVQFAFNRWELGDGAQTALVQLVRQLQQNPKMVVELEGYADPKGPHEYNVQLSQRRVEVVRRYLVQKGIELPRILSIGLGALNDPKMPDASKRRVTVKLMMLAD
jgi:outer membrane protein OmpA-like peptidoglycan-associated protein